MKWVIKTSSVRVASGNQDRIFRSLDDLPPALRERVIETIEGPNSETVLIANQAAYERIVEGGRKAQQAEGPSVIFETPQRSNALSTRHWVIGAGGAILALWAAFLWALYSR